MLALRCGRTTRGLSLTTLLAIASVACQGNTTGPVSPSASSPVSGPGSAASPYGGHAVPLIEVQGSVPGGGTGTVNATQTNRANDFEVTINVHGAPPDTDLYFQIVGDVAPATRGDGQCSPAPFPAPPIHAGLDDGIIHTSAGGAGATHVKFVIPEGGILGAFEPGVESEFKYRV